VCEGLLIRGGVLLLSQPPLLLLLLSHELLLRGRLFTPSVVVMWMAKHAFIHHAHHGAVAAARWGACAEVTLRSRVVDELGCWTSWCKHQEPADAKNTLPACANYCRGACAFIIGLLVVIIVGLPPTCFRPACRQAQGDARQRLSYAHFPVRQLRRVDGQDRHAHPHAACSQDQLTRGSITTRKPTVFGVVVVIIVVVIIIFIFILIIIIVIITSSSSSSSSSSS
jgi:hypothetical protein